jgi:hypothetical protein
MHTANYDSQSKPKLRVVRLTLRGKLFFLTALLFSCRAQVTKATLHTVPTSLRMIKSARLASAQAVAC